MKKYLFLIILMVIAGEASFAQQFKMRTFYLTKDSLFEVYKHGITDDSGGDGLYESVIDTPYRVHYFSEVKNGLQNGLFFEFYVPSGMPKTKGRYHDNEKDGEWYQWDEKGNLIKKEVWKLGKLVRSLP